MLASQYLGQNVLYIFNSHCAELANWIVQYKINPLHPSCQALTKCKLYGFKLWKWNISESLLHDYTYHKQLTIQTEQLHTHLN